MWRRVAVLSAKQRVRGTRDEGWSEREPVHRRHGRAWRARANAPSYPEHPYEKGRHRGAAVRVFMFMRVYACVQCVWVHECACVRMFVCMCYLHVCMRVYACVMCVCMRAGPVCSHWRGILLPCNLHLRVLDGAKCRVATAAVVLSGQR